MNPYKVIFTSLSMLFFSSLCFAAATQEDSKLAGIAVYERACKTCHAPTVSEALGAPEAFKKIAWEQRLQKAAAAAKENPTHYKTAGDYLLYQVKIGRGLMHHNGLCKELENMDCSDQAILAAIAYMSTEQKK